jgi:transcriptional regulator with XRE-family HTH domain
MDTDSVIILTPDVVSKELRRRIGAGTQDALASVLGVSPSLITEILKGRRTASPALLEKIGITEITTHVKNEQVELVVSAIQAAVKEVTHFSDLRKDHVQNIRIKTGAK